jgi:hypothetical protein
MATTPMPMQQLMMDSAVQTSVKMTAQMLGISEETVTKILQVGLPMVARVADENPELLKTMFAQSVKLMPESIQSFYSKVASDPDAQQRLVDEFRTMAGPMMESLNREAASASGISASQAERAMATSFPGVAQALGRENTEQTETGFRQRLKDLAA